jgi:hypothetical protein
MIISNDLSMKGLTKETKMGIFDDPGAKVVQDAGPRELAQHVSEDLIAAVRMNNIASETVGNKIRLMGQSRGTLEITCEATNSFRLNEDLGNHSRGIQTQAVTPPRWSSGGPPFTQSEMVTRVKTWLHEQRS